MTREAYPLTWPHGWKRTHWSSRISARFSRKKEGQRWGHRPISIAEAVSFTLDQLRMMAVPDHDVIISTDLKLRLDGLPYSSQRAPDDPGAAVWWRPANAKTDRVIAIDIYDRIADNIYAIGKTLEALRGIERWGGGEILERTFTGFAALPGPDTAGGIDPHVVIRVAMDATTEEKRTAYRQALSKAHPDHGGTPEQFHAVREAGKALGLA